MVAFGLLASKLNKEVHIFLAGSVHEQYAYLLKICTYNSIKLLKDEAALPAGIQAVVAMDTPKPSMLELNDSIARLIEDTAVIRMEIDHHLGADSAYFGDEGYRLVAAASSASELVGHIALAMEEDPKYTSKDAGGSFLARNFVLAVLTGIIADSRMGKYLKTRRERKLYQRFSSLFDRLLTQKTAIGSGNFASKEEVFSAIASLSSEEEECYRKMMSSRRKLRSLDFVIQDEAEIAALHEVYGEEVLTTIAKAVADALAEENGKLGLVAYPDHDSVSNLCQFRLRRCHSYRNIDLRDILETLGATNGGGHPGAVGFRYPKTVSADFHDFALSVAHRIDDIASQ